MIDSQFHVEIDGIKFRLAEDAEGEHYSFRQEPTRLQTSAVVQGTDRGNPTFQIRPDILLWEQSDWSGGEGQLKFDPNQPNRYQESRNVDAISEPGKLKLGPNWIRTNNNLDIQFGFNVALTRARGKLMGVSRDDESVFVWDDVNKRWGASVAGPGGGIGSQRTAGDASFLWYYDASNGTVVQWDETTFVQWADPPNESGGPLVELGDHLYLLLWNGANGDMNIYEIPKTGTPPVAVTLLYTARGGHTESYSNASLMAAGDNAIYFIQPQGQHTVVHKVVPSTAAGVGYGRPIATLTGLFSNAIWTHLGLVFIAGQEIATPGENDTNKILYLRDGGEFGAVGELSPRDPTDKLVVAHDAADFVDSYFLAEVEPSDGRDWTLYAINVIEGNLFGLRRVNMGINHQPECLVKHRGDWYFSGDGGAAPPNSETVFRIIGDEFSVDQGYVISPVHDFGMAEEKLLLSFRILLEPIPAGCTVSVEYQIDQDGAWTFAGLFNTTGGTSAEFVVSTDAASVTFRNLQLRVKMNNGGTSTLTPKLLSVEARATVLEFIDVWELLVDLSDELAQVQNRSWSGATLMDQLNTARRTKTVVDFKDGYRTSKPNSFEQHDVVVDRVTDLLDRPGEGIGQIVLKVMN